MPTSDDDAVPPTREACALRCDPDATLTLTTGLFRFAQRLSGVVVMLLELVRSQKLFVREGYETMSAYAVALGIKNDNTRKRMLAAGRAAWQVYPQRCRELVDSLLAHQGKAVVPELPTIPNQTALALLPQALKNSDDPDLLAEQLLDGNCTVARLTKIARPAKDKPQKAGRVNGQSRLVSFRIPHATLETMRADAEVAGVEYQTFYKRAAELGRPAALKEIATARQAAAGAHKKALKSGRRRG